MIVFQQLYFIILLVSIVTRPDKHSPFFRALSHWSVNSSFYPHGHWHLVVFFVVVVVARRDSETIFG